MLLFHKRTKKAVKLVWGVISVLIVLSMVVTYSGFAMLAGTSQPVTQDLTPEMIEALNVTEGQDVPLTDEQQDTQATGTDQSTPNTQPSNQTAPVVTPLDLSL